MEGCSSTTAGWLGLLAARHPARIVANRATHHCKPGIHSRLADGRMLCWQPPTPPGQHLAIDAELEQQPVPPALAKRYATSDPRLFWPLWTRAETRAKLHDIPIVVWLRAHDLWSEEDHDPVAEVVTTVRSGVVVSYGASALS